MMQKKKSGYPQTDPVTFHLSLLKEYQSMQKEIKDLQKRISETERRLKQLNPDNAGDITGILRERYNILNKEMDHLEKLTNSVLSYIETLPTSELRTLFRLYYLDNLTWIQVSFRMNTYFPNKIYSEDSCRMKHNRFLKK
ncbi:hypothetical protein [Diplocloster hominis]|uniref:hypothetical protein n=1 Tax=Diplocloster hominis TaxID=3079010 RepID=UPI0031BBA53D